MKNRKVYKWFAPCLGMALWKLGKPFNRKGLLKKAKAYRESKVGRAVTLYAPQGFIQQLALLERAEVTQVTYPDFDFLISSGKYAHPSRFGPLGVYHRLRPHLPRKGEVSFLQPYLVGESWYVWTSGNVFRGIFPVKEEDYFVITPCKQQALQASEGQENILQREMLGYLAQQMISLDFNELQRNASRDTLFNLEGLLKSAVAVENSNPPGIQDALENFLQNLKDKDRASSNGLRAMYLGLKEYHKKLKTGHDSPDSSRDSQKRKAQRLQTYKKLRARTNGNSGNGSGSRLKFGTFPTRRF